MKQVAARSFFSKRVARLSVIAILLAFVVGISLAMPADAHAATWRKSGDMLTNGKASVTVVRGYQSRVTWDADYTVYYRKSPSAASKELFSIYTSDLSLLGYYKGKVYYATGASGSMSGTVRCYNMNSKKFSVVVKDGYDYTIVGKYLVGCPNSGAWGPMDLHSINMKKAKAKKISSKAAGHRIRGSKVFYLDAKYSKSSGKFTFKVMRCNADGTHKKAVSKSVKGNFGNIDSDHTAIIYTDSGQKTIRF